MKLSMQSVLGWRAKQWHLVYSCMFEAMDSSGIALQLLTQYPSASIEWSLYYIWQQDGRVALVRGVDNF